MEMLIDGKREKVMGFQFPNGYRIIVDKNFPKRKKPCLIVQPTNNFVYQKVATFNNEIDADYFLEVIAYIAETLSGEEINAII